MKRTKIIDLLRGELVGQQVLVKGWVRTRRGNKAVSFVALNDGSIIHNLQIVLDLAKFAPEELTLITTGASLSVVGTLVASQGQGQTVELQAERVEVLGAAVSSSVRSRTCVHVPIPSGRSIVCATTWLWPSTASSTSVASSTSIRRSSPPVMPRELGRCSRSRRWTWRTSPVPRTEL